MIFFLIMDKQVGKARQEQELAFLNLQRFQEQKGHVSLPDELRAALETHGQLLSELLLAQSTLEELQTQMEKIRENLREQMQNLSQLPAHTPPLADLRGKLEELQFEYDTKTADMTPEHPEMQHLQVQIQQMEQGLAEEKGRILQAIEDGTAPELQDLKVRKAATLAELGSLEREITRLETQFSNLPREQKTLAQLTLETEIKTKLFTLLITQQKEAEIAEAQQGEPFHVLDPGVAPLKPVSPKLKINAGAGGLLGLVLALCLALAWECRQALRTTPEEERSPAQDSQG